MGTPLTIESPTRMYSGGGGTKQPADNSFEREDNFNRLGRRELVGIVELGTGGSPTVGEIVGVGGRISTGAVSAGMMSFAWDAAEGVTSSAGATVNTLSTCIYF